MEPSEPGALCIRSHLITALRDLSGHFALPFPESTIQTVRVELPSRGSHYRAMKITSQGCFSELQYSVGHSSFQNLPNTPNPNTQVAVAHSTFLTVSALVICLQVAASPGVDNQKRCSGPEDLPFTNLFPR